MYEFQYTTSNKIFVHKIIERLNISPISVFCKYPSLFQERYLLLAGCEGRKQDNSLMARLAGRDIDTPWPGCRYTMAKI